MAFVVQVSLALTIQHFKYLRVVSKSKLEFDKNGPKFLYDQEGSQNEFQKNRVQIPYMPKPDNVEG